MDKIYVYRADYDCISFILENLINPNILKKKQILIKPNIRSCHSPNRAKNTNPRTLDCVLKYIKKNYKNDIIVADSSIIGVDTKKSAEVSGIKSVCDKYHVPFYDLRDYGYRRIEIPIAPYFIEISELFFENNYIINMPKLKSTYGFPLSLSAKNLKGIISDQSKFDFHHYGVQQRVSLLNSFIHSDLSIIDGLYSLSLDTVLETNLVIASTNSLSLDYFISNSMGYTEKDMIYLTLAEKQYEVLYSDENIKKEFSSIKLNTVSKDDIKDKFCVSIIGTPCSACSGCIYKAIAKRKKNTSKIIIAGKYKYPINDDCVFVGNCAIENLPSDHGNIVKGCPPQIKDIIKKLDNGE